MCWAPRAVSSQADEALTNQWHAIDWQKAHRSVRKLQVRIVKAEQEGKRGKVQALQRLLTSSFYAKALAVKRVTENQGRRTAGSRWQDLEYPQWQMGSYSFVKAQRISTTSFETSVHSQSQR